MDQREENDKAAERQIASNLRRADLLDDTVAPGWAKKHIVTPFVHSAFYEPAAIVLGKNFKESKAETASYLNKGNAQVPFLSIESGTASSQKNDTKAGENSLGETMVEIVSGAAGAGIVYAIAGKGAGGLLRAGAQKGLLGNTLPKYVATENGSMVAGAAIYDAARHPNAGETRLGNTIAGAASFAVFVKGNSLTSELSTGLRIASLPVIGAVGGLVQKQISVGLAQERMINSSEFGEAVLGGAVINTVLPGATKAISMGIDHLNTRAGRGIPVERVAKEKGWLSKSTELDALIYANPYARVRFDAQMPNSLNSLNATITLSTESAAKLGHELKHLELRKQSDFSEPYKTAAQSLEDGFNTRAERQFLSARKGEEVLAMESENKIATQFGQLETSTTIAAGQHSAWANQWQWFRHTEGKELPRLDYSITGSAPLKIGESKELTARAKELSKEELATQGKITDWHPDDADGGLSLADAQFIQKSVEKYPHLYEILEAKIQDSHDQLFRVMAMDVLNGRATIAKKADLRELQDYAEGNIRTAENHFDDVARSIDGTFENNVWDDAPHMVQREFKSAEEAQAYAELLAKFRNQIDDHEMRITPQAVHALSAAGMSSHPIELLLKIVERNDLNKIARFNPDATQLAQAVKVWETAPTLPIEIALELHGRPVLDVISADKAWKETTRRLYDNNDAYGSSFGEASTFQHMNLIATDRDHAAFRAEWSNLKTQGENAILTSDPAYWRQTAQHFFADKFQPAQIEQLIQTLGARLRGNQDASLLSKTVAELNAATLRSVFERLKARTRPLSDHEAVIESRELNAEAQAVTITGIFGERANAYLDTLEANGISFQSAIDRLHLNSKEVNKEFANWYFSHSDKSIADRHRIAFAWNELSPAQRGLDYAELNRVVLANLAERKKGIMGMNDEGYALMRELDVAKLHPSLDGPFRRAAIVGMSGYTTSTYAAEQALSKTINASSFEYALGKLGVPSNYKVMWADLTRAGKDNKDGVFPDTAKRAVVLSSIFGERLPTWYDVQQSNGRGALTASNIVPFAWTEGLSKPISIGKESNTQQVNLSDLLFHNASKTMSELANLVKGWEHFQTNQRHAPADLSTLANVEQLTKEIQRNALKASGEGNFALTKSKLGEWAGHHRGSPNNEFVDQLPRSNPSEQAVRGAIKAADPETLLKVSRQFGDDSTMLYDFARAAQILMHDKERSSQGLLDAPLPSTKARDFLFDIFDLQRRAETLPKDQRAWDTYFNSKDLSAVDREVILRNWQQLPEALKASPGRDAARHAFTSLSPEIPASVRAELARKDLKEWERVAANNAWKSSQPSMDLTPAGKRDAASNDRSNDFWSRTLPEQLAKGQEANYAQAGTEHLIHALYKHLNGQQRSVLAAAYETEFRKRGVLSNDSKLELIKDLKANSFFDNIKAAGLKIEDIPNTRLQNAIRGDYQYAAALRLAQIFGPRSTEWLAARAKANENFHDATEYLPFLSKRESSGLSDYLLKHSKHNAEEIRVVAAGWESLTPQERSLPIAEMVRTIRSRTYPNAQSPEFAIEAARWAIPEGEYHQMEARFEASKSVPSPFPTEKVFAGESGLKGFFMRRDDPRGLFLGHHTNSCQHPQGDAASAAWYGQEKSNSGFFVVTNSKNEIVAMSWAVLNENKLLFDNVEAKGLGSRAEEVRQIYRNAAKDLISSGKVDQVNLGTQHNDLPPRGMPTANADDLVKLPADYLEQGGYSDAATQAIVARR